MKRLAIAAFAFCVLFSSALYAGDAAHDLLSRIVDRYSHASGVVAKFAEEGAGDNVHGTITFKGKDKFRLELDDKTIVCNGKVIWIYTPSQNRVTIDAYHQKSNSLTPEFFIAKVPDNAHARILEQGSGKYTRMLLEPPTEDAWGFIKSLTIDVEESNATIHKVEIASQDSAPRVITIQSLKLDTKPAESTFEFTPPKDATVVDLR
jgi:chaperone LolA